jgi:hypothetical protein
LLQKSVEGCCEQSPPAGIVSEHSLQRAKTNSLTPDIGQTEPASVYRLARLAARRPRGGRATFPSLNQAPAVLMPATIRARSRRGSVIAIFSIRFAIQSGRRIGSRISGANERTYPRAGRTTDYLLTG